MPADLPSCAAAARAGTVAGKALPTLPPEPGLLADAAEHVGLDLQAGVVASRVADLFSPTRRGLGKDGRTALVATGAEPIAPGDMVVFLKPVAIAVAVVRRDGRVQAAGHPADHVRLGVAEKRLDELAGTPDVIGRPAAGARLGGKVKGAPRRAMTPTLAVRFTLLMTVTPGRGLRRAGAGPAGGPDAGAVAAPVPGADRDGGLHMAGSARARAAAGTAGLGAGRHGRQPP